MHEEPVPLEDQVQGRSPPFQADGVDLLHRRKGRALLVPEAGEVVDALQVPAGLGHGVPVQGPGTVHVPAPQVLERVGRGAFLQAVHVALGHGVRPGEEAFGGGEDRHHPHVRGQVCVEGGQEPVGVPGLRELHQHALGAGVDARVRAPRALGHGGRGVEGVQRLPQVPLHAAQHRLDLEAGKARAHVGTAEEIGVGHGDILSLPARIPHRGGPRCAGPRRRPVESAYSIPAWVMTVDRGGSKAWPGT